MQEEEITRTRSVNRTGSVTSGVNPLARRGSAVVSSVRIKLPQQVAVSPPEKFEEDEARKSVGLSFSGLYPNRASMVEDDGQSDPLPPIDEDDARDSIDFDHPFSDHIPEPPETAQPLRRPPTAPPLPPPQQAIISTPSLPNFPPQATPTPTILPQVEYIKLGIGWKQCPSVALIWQERFFVMKRDGSIHYFADRDSYVGKYAPKGVINLADIQNNPNSRNGIFDSVQLLHEKLNIYVKSKNHRVYKLKFGTAEEAQSWRDAIFKHLELLVNR